MSPAASASKQSTTSPSGRKRRRIRACFSVNAVPCGAITFCTPASNAVIRSSCPSITTADRRSMIARFDLCRPNSTAPFVKSIVSGEFTYFAALASASNTRPLKAITSPLSLQIGNISRPRKRS